MNLLLACLAALAAIRAAQFLDLRWAWALLVLLAALAIHGLLQRARRRRCSLPPMPPNSRWVWMQAYTAFRLGIKRRRRGRREPRGFCPICRYRIDPGRCPECGTEVPAADLLTRQRSFLASHAGKIAVGTVLLSAFLVGNRLYQRADWVGRLSTTHLMRIHRLGFTSGPVLAALNHELEIRYFANKLSAGQRDEFYRNSVHVQLQTKSPYPAGIDVVCRLEVNVAAPQVQHQGGRCLRECRVFLDDDTEPIYQESEDRVGGKWWIRLPPLDPGEHRLKLTGLLTLSKSPQTALVDATAIITTPIEASARITIADRPLASFAQPVSNPELAARVESTVSVRSGTRYGWRNDAGITVWIDRELSVPVAGQLSIRPAGSATFERVGPLFIRRGRRSYTVPAICDPGDSVFFDIRIEPDAAVAIQNWANRYYGDVIERSIQVARRSRILNRSGWFVPSESRPPIWDPSGIHRPTTPESPTPSPTQTPLPPG